MINIPFCFFLVFFLLLAVIFFKAMPTAKDPPVITEVCISQCDFTVVEKCFYYSLNKGIGAQYVIDIMC